MPDSRTSRGKAFQTVGAATENAQVARTARDRGTLSRVAPADRSGRAGAGD